MNIDLYSTILQANVVAERDEHARIFDRLGAVQLWCGLVGLADSQSFRLARGPREGFIRDETFLSLLRHVINPCTDVRWIRRVGEAILLVSSELRPILECLLLADQVVTRMAVLASDENFPFAMRGAIHAGPLRRLGRPPEDYVGGPINTLAKVFSIQTSAGLFLRTEDAESAATALADYQDFLACSPAALELNEDFLRLDPDRKKFLAFDRHFAYWRLPARSPADSSRFG